MELCLECNHLCHCKGVAPNPNTNQCMGDDGNCLCIVCTHNKSRMEDNMVKKTIGWVWKIICWPFQLIHKWVNNWING